MNVGFTFTGWQIAFDIDGWMCCAAKLSRMWFSRIHGTHCLHKMLFFQSYY